MKLFPGIFFPVWLILCPTWVSGQFQTQYPDTIMDAYNTITKSKDKFFGGSSSATGRLVPLSVVLHKSDTFVSLPTGSYITVGFTDNYIMDAPGQPDIFIGEEAGAGEYANVFVSSDNVEYTLLGVAGNGITNEFDLATIAYEKPVYYIKIVGNDAKGRSPGFDVIGIYGIPGANKPVPGKSITLTHVLFETNRSALLPESFASLDELVRELELNGSLRIEIRGHTDSIGKDAANQVLSEQRAKSVLEYLVSKGVDRRRLAYKGFGSKQPIASNSNEEGRSINRRVEFVILE